MGQILLEDKIGTLSHSSGVISLTASRLTIGGQQYNTSALSRTISDDVTMVANTRYQIFAVVSGGTVSLKISSNENSTGPSGFSVWKLVGAFYSNGLSPVAFGSFVNIEGSPSTNITSHTPQLKGAITDPNIGSTGSIIGRWRRVGDVAEIQCQASISGTSVTTGSGDYYFTLPLNMLANTSKIAGDSGGASYFNSGVIAEDAVTRLAYGGIAIYVPGGNFIGQNIPNANWLSTGDLINVQAYVPITGWSNIPIKDL